MISVWMRPIDNDRAPIKSVTKLQIFKLKSKQTKIFISFFFQNPTESSSMWTNAKHPNSITWTWKPSTQVAYRRCSARTPACAVDRTPEESKPNSPARIQEELVFHFCSSKSSACSLFLCRNASPWTRMLSAEQSVFKWVSRLRFSINRHKVPAHTVQAFILRFCTKRIYP